MSFIDCITGKIQQGLLTKGQVQTLQNKFDALHEKYSRTMSDADAAAQAAADIISVEASKLKQRRSNEMNYALMQEEIVGKLEAAEAKGMNFGKAVQDFVEKGVVRKQSIMKQYLSSLDQFVEEFRSKFAGLQRRSDGMRLVVSEVLGKATGSQEAKEYGLPCSYIWQHL